MDNKSNFCKKIQSNLKKALLVFWIAALSFVIFFSVGFKKSIAFAASTSAECMVVLESSTNRILYQKNAHKKRPMASTTKILTAITVIENVKNLDKICAIPSAAVGVEGSSIYLEAGEELSLRDLLYGLMLQSGNDCAESLAILTAGSVEKFALLMNEKAQKIGAKNSNFVTPHGLHDDNHYTTAYDLALISSYALKNEDFQEIVKTKKHTTIWKGRDYDRVIMNKNKLLFRFEGCDGVKTGFTKKAGRCYVASATRNNMQVVCAVLNCGPMFEDSAALMNSAFNEYSMTEIIKGGEGIDTVEVNDAKNPTVRVGIRESVFFPLAKGEREKIKIEACPNSKLSAPLAEYSEIGTIKIYMENELLFERKLYNIDEAGSKNLFDRLKDIADTWTRN